MGFLRTGNRKARYNKAKKFNTEKSDRLVKLFAEVDNRMRKLDSILKEKLVEDDCKLLHTVIQSDDPYLNLIRIAEKIRVGNGIGDIGKDDMLLLIDVLLNDLLESLNEDEDGESGAN